MWNIFYTYFYFSPAREDSYSVMLPLRPGWLATTPAIAEKKKKVRLYIYYIHHTIFIERAPRRVWCWKKKRRLPETIDNEIFRGENFFRAVVVLEEISNMNIRGGIASGMVFFSQFDKWILISIGILYIEIEYSWNEGFAGKKIM